MQAPDRWNPEARAARRRRGCRTALLLACAFALGCRPDADEGPLVVVVSGDMAGWIVPCGCASNQSGGMPRRGTYLGQLGREAVLIVADAGGALRDKSLYDQLKFEATLRGEKAMGIQAHNIGAAEAALGATRLDELAAKTGVPLVSANVRDADGRLLAPPIRIVEAAGRRVALVGVLGERFAVEPLRVAPPRQAILDTLSQFAGQYDNLVVLAYLDEGPLRQLAETLPEADAVVGGPTGQPIPPTSVGPVLLISATNQGKFLARLDAAGSDLSGGWSGAIVELSDRFADDPTQVANLNRYYEELARLDLTPQQTSWSGPLLGHLPADYRIAGTAACQACHAEEQQCWDKSKHARAWESLRAKGAQVDPDCQRCHATGYGLPGGFASVRRSPALVNVGCEACHGPSRAHVADGKHPTTYFGQAANQCRACHDAENSPEFDFETYWAKIRHGEPAAKSDAASPGGEPRPSPAITSEAPS